MPRLVSKSLKPPIQQSLEAINRTAGLGFTARGRQAWGAGCGRDMFGKYRRRFSWDGLLLRRWGSRRWSERQGDSDPEPSKTIQMLSVGEPRILCAEKPDSWGCLSLIRIRDAAVTGRAWGGRVIPSAWGVLGCKAGPLPVSSAVSWPQKPLVESRRLGFRLGFTFSLWSEGQTDQLPWKSRKKQGNSGVREAAGHPGEEGHRSLWRFSIRLC